MINVTIRNLKTYLISENPEQWRQLNYCLADFSPDKSKTGNLVNLLNNYYVIDSKELKNFSPAIIYFIFVAFNNYPNLGRMEKIAWIIPFLFKGEKYIISFEKFGLLLRAKKTNKRDIKELLHKLRSATKIGDKLLEPAVKIQISKGNITLQNKYLIFSNMYLYFRERANYSYTKKNHYFDENSNYYDLTKHAYLSIEDKWYGFYYTVAMLDAFFSMLEHICVLMLAFIDYDLQKEDLNEFIFCRWTEKFKRVFKPQEDPDIMRIFNKLYTIKEKYRNTFSHGGYEKDGLSLVGIHTEVGVVPITLSKTKDSVHYSFFPILEGDFSTICKILDEFDNVLHKKPFNNIMKFIKSGVDIYFDRKHRKEYKEVIYDDRKLHKYIDKLAYYQDRYANMDW